MEILKALIPLALFLGIIFVCLFIWAAKSGQFDDLDTPSQRMLLDDDEETFNTDMDHEKRKEL